MNRHEQNLSSEAFNEHREWFANYFPNTSDVTFDFTGGNQDVIISQKRAKPGKVTVADTGLYTVTGGRVNRAKDYVGFMLTYGDGAGNINIAVLLDFYKKTWYADTISAYNFGQYRGIFEIDKDGCADQFREKSVTDGDGTIFEREPLNTLVKMGKLSSYLHYGMDTMREKGEPERLWNSGQAPRKEWQD